MPRISPKQKEAFKPVLAAIAQLAQNHETKGLLALRPGYRYATRAEGGSAKTVATAAVVLAVVPKQLDAASVRAKELEAQYKVPVEAQEATLDEQLAAFDQGTSSFQVPATPARSAFELALQDQLPQDFAPLKRPPYEKPPNLELSRVKEQMSLTVSASPEQGWPVLEGFVSSVKHTLTVGMYQFTAPHIVEAVTACAEAIDKDVLITLHPVPEAPARSGVKKNDEPEADVIAGLEGAAQGRFGFQWAPVFTGGVFSSAYHIKVAVGDSKRFWLSSGNWQSSNQPGPDVLADKPSRFQHDYNRDYHAVIENASLAGIFEGYLKYDFATAKKLAHPPPKSWDGPDVVVPADYEPPPDFFAQPPQFFPPLKVNRVVDVQPLLTPDNYAEKILQLIKSARQSIEFQNQYINLRADENFPELDGLVEALLDRQEAGVAVRIICRDMMTTDKLDLLVAMGFDPDSIRFQPACHNKCIIVDAKVIAFGSHNWSNEGVTTNRDASLIFYDAEIAAHFQKIYDYDWKRLAKAKPAQPKRSTRLADSDDGAGSGSFTSVER